jgi:hypothetical protein
MRVLFGMIIGAVLTVAGAYLHDSDLPGGSNQRLVNWDAAGDLSAWAVDRAREQWTRLVQM